MNVTDCPADKETEEVLNVVVVGVRITFWTNGAATAALLLVSPL
jgi:hypothetical protein